ncbi:esterase/lipase family protein [Acerihabitans arboris]|uniref:PGAP1-like protein n=1 Tax=Acerihabitans arboris TaxID=2691583 RepID=A0A845SXN4_9GAMM|nr:hypothetical protein [Acerihabitans arboris]NDL65635.1 hypothetical protein [Acerihabitans arboris]
MDKPEKENVTYHLPEWDKQGRQYYRICSQPAENNHVAACVKIADKVIPVIFLPGVMGTNLRNIKGKEPIWFGNSPGSLDTAWGWVLKTAEERKKLLNPETTEVDDGGKILYDGLEGNVFPLRSERGWGAGLFTSYGYPLHVLQLMLNDWKVLAENIVHGTNYPTSRKLLIGKELNAQGEDGLTEAEVRHSYEFLYPLHVFGYNWLQSNVESAKHLEDYIDQVMITYHGRLAVNKVILVTHSMGGLVARHYSENMGGNENILGIVHGVMPDLGSPAAYRRMKVGEQAFAVGNVIGNSAEKLMPVLAQSPGPLQLLPGKAYGPGWLKIQGDNGMESRPLSDPYKEIYQNKKDWWRLYEAGISGGNPEDEWKKYHDIIKDKVIDFIDNLNGKYHPNTWAFYGASEKYKSDEYLMWKQTRYYPDEVESPASWQYPGPAPAIAYPSGSRIKIPVPPTERKDRQNHRQYKLVSSGSPGDGTVPVKSGYISWPGIRSQIAVDVDHEGAYASNNQNGEETAVALNFTLRAIVKMVQNIPACGECRCR